MIETQILEKLMQALPTLKNMHARTSPSYQLLEVISRQAVETVFKNQSCQANQFSPFGSIIFPYFQMGAIDSVDLFGLDELILFSFYWANRNRYKKVLDIGANIGLHTLILSKCGYEVKLCEPDPVHFKRLQEVIQLNCLQNVTAHCAAVSNRTGTAEFVRVIGNTTSSHLAGSKNPYGPTEKFSVPIIDIKDVISWADLIKMDVEGHELEIIRATKREDWQSTDALLEIGTPENAQGILEHLTKIHVRAFAQKNNWAEVCSLEGMPKNYKEGSLFISVKPEMPWS
jgi:FkbM family methyltransferase